MKNCQLTGLIVLSLFDFCIGSCTALNSLRSCRFCLWRNHDFFVWFGVAPVRHHKCNCSRGLLSSICLDLAFEVNRHCQFR